MCTEPPSPDIYYSGAEGVINNEKLNPTAKYVVACSDNTLYSRYIYLCTDILHYTQTDTVQTHILCVAILDCRYKFPYVLNMPTALQKPNQKKKLDSFP